MKKISAFTAGIGLCILLAVLSQWIASFIPMHLISAGVFAMLLGMALNPIIVKLGKNTMAGIQFTSKTILKAAIVLMGITLSFSQVLHTGKYSLIVMCFTLLAAFGFGNLFGRLFKMRWQMSNLIAAGTGICGGSAIAAISPVIDAEDSDVAYAISATFIFDIAMVILFPIMGHAFGMSDLGFGLWAGTAVNDTSSVVAAGYAFSDAAGQFATIVKLTRTLSIVPVVLIFSAVNQKIKSKTSVAQSIDKKLNIIQIFPWFIILFLLMVALRSVLDIFVSADTVTVIASAISKISKFAMIMALGAIGFKTNFKKVSKSGWLPMLHGFIISAIVVVVSYGVQLVLGQV